MTISPLMREALREAARYRRPPWAKDVPGGRKTAVALSARGLAVIEGGRLVLTDTGRREVGA